MNKYEEALEVLNNFDTNYIEIIDIALNDIKELVERATPKEPFVIIRGMQRNHKCSNCKRSIDTFSPRSFNFCPYCGQALEWK